MHLTRPIRMKKWMQLCGMVRTEIGTVQTVARTLGHVFTDGPEPTGLRYY